MLYFDSEIWRAILDHITKNLMIIWLLPCTKVKLYELFDVGIFCHVACLGNQWQRRDGYDKELSGFFLASLGLWS